MTEPVSDTMKVLEAKIGALAVQINRCQAIVFMIFHGALDTDIGRSEAIFFTLRSDSTQRDVTTALVKSVLFLGPEWKELAREIELEIQSFNAMSGRRNDFIHAIWVEREGEPPSVLLGLKARLKDSDPVVVADAPIADINNLYDRLTSLHDRFQAAYKEQKDWVSTRQARQARPQGLAGPNFLQGANSTGGGLLGAEEGVLPPPRPWQKKS